MFVLIVGNVEQNVFRLAITSDPSTYLSKLQASNPYELDILSKVCVRNKNAAASIEGLGRLEMKAYEGKEGWVTNVPVGLIARLSSDRYLRSLADKAGIDIIDKNESSTHKNSADLQRLTVTTKRKNLTFQTVLDSVERAYSEGIPIDKII